ncbi:MAG TPA: tetratricopeptide repeat protein [Anaerolineae bacterium]
MGSGRVAYQHAVDRFSRAIDLDPNFVEAYLQRGILYWREIQNYHHAIRDMTRVLALDPERTQALYTRALAYQSRGDFDQAIADFEQFLAHNSDSTWRDSAELQLAGARELRAAREAARSH